MAPRSGFDVQYISHPDHHWRILRKEHANRYKEPATVAIETWHEVRFEISGSVPASSWMVRPCSMPMTCGFPKACIGLSVDSGTTGYFANLKVTVQQ